MSQRLEFVLLARTPGANVRLLCRRFDIAPKTGYKWLKRYAIGGVLALQDQSRRPRHSPRRTADAVVEQVIALRQAQPTWSGRKLRRRLLDLGQRDVPAPSTCTQILRRANLLPQGGAGAARAWERFERAYPNELWQMDHKGHFATQSGVRCHPLTVLDDCSRFNLLLAADPDEQGATVQAQLTTAFTLYGVPEEMLCDNGPPWGCAEPTCPYTSLTVWLLRLGIRVLHGRPYHPQTQGKDERFHRTLLQDVIRQHTWRDLHHCQQAFDRFRQVYNCERPHDALGQAVPITRYRPSPRSLPAALPPIEYPAGTLVRTLRSSGLITFGGQTWYIGRPFGGLPIGLCPASLDGQWEVFFSSHRLGLIDLTSAARPKHTARSIYSTSSSDLPSGGEADRFPCHPLAQSGAGREPSPLPATLPIHP